MAKRRDPSQKVEALLSKVRPYIQMHGGDVTLQRIDGGTAHLKIYGACVGCSLAAVTYDKMITGLILQDVPGITKVIYESE